MRTMAALSVLALAACGKAPAEPAPTGGEESSAIRTEPVRDAAAITAVGDLVGEYRVAGIDDAEVPGGEGIALSIDGPMISFDPTCAGFVWRIGFAGAALSTRRHSEAAPATPGAPVSVCAVAVTPAQRALARALDAATRAERTPANGIRLSGGGHAVLLFSQ